MSFQTWYQNISRGTIKKQGKKTYRWEPAKKNNSEHFQHFRTKLISRGKKDITYNICICIGTNHAWVMKNNFLFDAAALNQTATERPWPRLWPAPRPSQRSSRTTATPRPKVNAFIEQYVIFCIFYIIQLYFAARNFNGKFEKSFLLFLFDPLK